MWTEILTEDFGVTHVNGHHVVFALTDNVEEWQVRGIKEALKHRQVIEYQKEQVRDLANRMDAQKRMMERIEQAGYDPIINEPTNTPW